MTSHPYISGPGSVVQMIGYLRKNFPASVTSDTVKKFALASKNESYVINALPFIGVVDDEGKRTSKGHDIFLLSDADFPKAFEGLVREAYSDLFDIRGEDAWTLSKNELTTYFRTTDRTSEIIGGRQAGLFHAFRTLSGHGRSDDAATDRSAARARPAKAKATAQKKPKVVEPTKRDGVSAEIVADKESRSVSMTVRIEINLPSNGSQDTYDAIFRSIRANLIND